MTSSSYDLIIPPGDTLIEVLEDRGIKIEELIEETKVSKEYMNNVLIGKRAITKSFAQKLEAILNIQESFWINLQHHYDEEIKSI